MEAYKTEIVNKDIFLKNRPDMEVHDDKTINTAIFSAASLLNSETHNQIHEVWEYNKIDPIPNHPLYRSEYEISQLREAIIMQTHYNIAMGNDFTIGGGSYSIGNVNASFNRPENRPQLAPGVTKLLQNARVYFLTGFNINDQAKGKECKETKYLTRELGDISYVHQHQPNAKPGNVAYISDQNIVNFGNPQDLNITTYNTKRIAGGRGFQHDYYPIDDVPNIAFFGNDDFGTYSAVHRGDLKAMGINPNDIKKVWDPVDQVFKYIDQFPADYWGSLSKNEIYNAIYASGIAWRADFIYRQDWIVQTIDPLNELSWFRSLQDNNQGNDPNNGAPFWEKLANQSVDINLIIDQIKQYVDQIVDAAVDANLDKKKHQFKQETKNQILTFKDQADYRSYRDTNNLLDSDFEDIPDPFNADFAIKSRDNVFSANNTFQRPLNIVEAQNNNQAVTKAYADQIRAIANSKQDRMSAGNGINLVGNRIDNVLWGRKIAINEKLTLVFEAQNRINTNNSSGLTWNWQPETHMAGYLFVFILKNRDQGKPDTGYQFRQTFWNNLSYQNIIFMPINDGSDTATNAGVWQEDFLTFKFNGSEIRQLKGNWSIFLGTLHIRIYKITYEGTLS